MCLTCPASQALQAEEARAVAAAVPPAAPPVPELGRQQEPEYETDDDGEDDVSISGMDILGPLPSFQGKEIPALHTPQKIPALQTPQKRALPQDEAEQETLIVRTPGTPSPRKRILTRENKTQGSPMPLPQHAPAPKSACRGRRTPKKNESVNDQDLEMPRLDDQTAARPTVGSPTLSKAAIRMRSQRIFSRRANGELKVSETIWTEWHQRGARRTMLESIFQQCGFDPVSCLETN